MSAELKDAVWKACELLAKERSLLTVQNIKTKLYNLEYQSNKKLHNLEHDISDLINKWRITKLNPNHTKDDDFNIYKALAIPKKENHTITSGMQKKIFDLECELNKYKHAACRANKRAKLLEKKLYATINSIKQERQYFIANLKEMLAK